MAADLTARLVGALRDARRKLARRDAYAARLAHIDELLEEYDTRPLSCGNSGRITGYRMVDDQQVFNVHLEYGDDFEVVRYAAKQAERGGVTDGPVVWSTLSDVIEVVVASEADNWNWWANTRCKYIELRVDMRDSHCVIKDRDGKVISIAQLRAQHGEGGIEAASHAPTAAVRDRPATNLHCPSCGATDGNGCGACPSPQEPDARENRITTHWADCWRDPKHHACAVAMIDRLTPSAQEGGDAARLDFIASNARTCSIDMGGNHRWMGAGPGLANLRGSTFREAIDKAMLSAAGKEGA